VSQKIRIFKREKVFTKEYKIIFSFFVCPILMLTWSRYSSVIIVTVLRARWPMNRCSTLRRNWEFVVSKASTPVMVLALSPTGAPRALSLWAKQVGRESNNPFTPTAKVESEWIYTWIPPPTCLHDVTWVDFYRSMKNVVKQVWWHRIFSEYSNICPTRCNVTQFILSRKCSTCFGWYHHPSSGAQTTVSTASGICHTVTATCRYSGR